MYEYRWEAQNKGGTLSAVCDGEGLIQMIYPDTGEILWELRLWGLDFSNLCERWNVEPRLAFSPNSKYLAVSYGMGHVYIVELAQHQVIKQFRLFPEVVYTDSSFQKIDLCCYYNQYTRMDFSPSGHYLAVRVRGDFDPQESDGRKDMFTPVYFRTVFVLDMYTLTVCFSHSFSGEKKEYANVAVLAFSPNEELLAVGALGGQLKILSLPKGAERATFSGLSWIPNPIAVDDRKLVVFLKEDFLLYASEGIEILAAECDEKKGWQIVGRIDSRILREAGIENKWRSYIGDIFYQPDGERLLLQVGESSRSTKIAITLT